MLRQPRPPRVSRWPQPTATRCGPSRTSPSTRSCSRSKGESVDVFGLFESGGDVAVGVLVVRGGVIQDRREFFFEKSEEVDPAAFLDAFLPQFYDANPFLPWRSICRWRSRTPSSSRAFLAARRGAKVAVRVPQRGAGGERLRSARGQCAGAPQGPFSPARRRSGARRRAAGPRPRSSAAAAPDRGLRHLAPAGHGQRRVAGRLRGRGSRRSPTTGSSTSPRRTCSRPDDFKSMAEAVERRYRKRPRRAGVAMPDLVLVDGGRGQLQAALTALDRLGVELPVVGLAKQRGGDLGAGAAGARPALPQGPGPPAHPACPRRGAPIRDHAASRPEGQADAEDGPADIPGIGPARSGRSSPGSGRFRGSPRRRRAKSRRPWARRRPAPFCRISRRDEVRRRKRRLKREPARGDTPAPHENRLRTRGRHPERRPPRRFRNALA